MRDIIRMIVVLGLLAACSGGLLAAVKSGTAEQIEVQQLKFVKGPAIRDILKGSINDPIQDRFKLMDGEAERTFFVGKYENRPTAVAYETFGQGYGGDIGIMVGVELESDKLVGIGITTHSETPGLGSRAKTDPGFRKSFEGLSIEDPIEVGEIDAVSGATITSAGVCKGITQSADFYERLKPKIVEKAKSF
jgi:electron transport complex protein RnfG